MKPLNEPESKPADATSSQQSALAQNAEKSPFIGLLSQPEKPKEQIGNPFLVGSNAGKSNPFVNPSAPKQNDNNPFSAKVSRNTSQASLLPIQSPPQKPVGFAPAEAAPKNLFGTSQPQSAASFGQSGFQQSQPV